VAEIFYDPDFTQAGGRVVTNVSTDDEESHANAALIRQIPELIQALRDAVNAPAGTISDSAEPFRDLIKDTDN